MIMYVHSCFQMDSDLHQDQELLGTLRTLGRGLRPLGRGGPLLPKAWRGPELLAGSKACASVSVRLQGESSANSGSRRLNRSRFPGRSLGPSLSHFKFH